LVRAIQRHPATSKIALDRTRIESRRGTNIAKIAAARTLLRRILSAAPNKRAASGDVGLAGQNGQRLKDIWNA
jgi:hypothetical protein